LYIPADADQSDIGETLKLCPLKGRRNRTEF
jgi:hypothetical protein